VSTLQPGRSDFLPYTLDSVSVSTLQPGLSECLHYSLGSVSVYTTTYAQ
jgi:hypothetical protein